MSCKDIKAILGGSDDCYSPSHSAEENGKRFEFIRKKGDRRVICRIKIDGCIIKNNSIRCDYLFMVTPPKSYHFVELKGSDIDHAFDQIKNTISFVKRKSVIAKKDILAILFLVQYREPRMKSLRN
jgi:hypothetical protein